MPNEMNKQIEEMAKDLCHAPNCELKKANKPCYKYCKAYIYALRAYHAGYRKQSEGEWVAKDNFNGRCSIAICSNCGTNKALAALVTIEMVTKAFPYCEKCGARMTKGANNEN